MPQTAASIHHLTSSDIGLMRELNTLFGQAFDDPELYDGAPPDDAYLLDLLSREHIHALVALLDGAVIGGLVAYELDKFERARREIYIYDLAVAEAHRRQGVATALIDHLRALAAARGAWVIFVQADYGDAPAIALYQKLGSREEVLHYDITPTSSPRPEAQ